MPKPLLESAPEKSRSAAPKRTTRAAPKKASKASPKKRASKKSQGAQANSNGRIFECLIEAMMVQKGFQVVAYQDYALNPEMYGDNLLIREAPYRNLYGGEAKSEFLLKSAEQGLDVRIECRWQQASGSVDEKFPYLFINSVEYAPEPNVWICVGGGGARPAAVSWLRREAAARPYPRAAHPAKEVRVFTIEELLVMLNRRVLDVKMGRAA
jgi:hypothetical protein